MIANVKKLRLIIVPFLFRSANLVVAIDRTIYNPRVFHSVGTISQSTRSWVLNVVSKAGIMIRFGETRGKSRKLYYTYLDIRWRVLMISA